MVVELVKNAVSFTMIISENRKEYYLKALKIRLDYLANNFVK